MSVTDVVIVPPHTTDTRLAPASLAGDPPIQLLPDLTITRLPGSDVQDYERACEPRHLNFDPGVSGGHRYAFVRHPAPAELNTLHGFDPDGVLHKALAMSRYLVLNAH
jgi:hypothetical protein